MQQLQQPAAQVEDSRYMQSQPVMSLNSINLTITKISSSKFSRVYRSVNRT